MAVKSSILDANTKCAVEEIGKNSVTPSIMARIKALYASNMNDN